MKLFVQLVREILRLSGKSQGSSETSDRGNHVKHVHPFVIKHMLLRNVR